MHKAVCSRFMFGLTNSFITLRSKNVIKKDFPYALLLQKLIKSWKNHNYCLNDLTIFSTGSEGRSYGLTYFPLSKGVFLIRYSC